jgi:hypothetical protein
MAPAYAAATSEDLPDLLKQISATEYVDGCKVGAGANPGRFFLIAEKILKLSKLSDYRTMLKDSSPHVRVMGALGISLKYPAARWRLANHLGDRTQIQWLNYGCMVRRATVGYAIEVFRRNPHALGHGAGDRMAWCN